MSTKLMDYSKGIFFKSEEDIQKAKILLTEAGIDCEDLNIYSAVMKEEVCCQLNNLAENSDDSYDSSEEKLNELQNAVICEPWMFNEFEEQIVDFIERNI